MKKVILLLCLVAVSSCGMEQIDEGERGILTEWGKVVGEPLMPGFHTYNPVSKDIFSMDVRETKLEGKEQCFTKDTQLVQVTYAITGYPDPTKIGWLFSQFGRNWAETVVPQVVQSSIKDVIGQIIADDLVSKREETRVKAFSEIQTALKERGVIATRLDLTNLDFDDAYERAVEAKVVAVQNALAEKNKTIQVQEQAKQTVESAKADAEAMRIKTQALTQNKSLVDYEAVQKWDGKLPEYMLGGSSVPFININKKP